jgi:hypothetical protein
MRRIVVVIPYMLLTVFLALVAWPTGAWLDGTIRPVLDDMKVTGTKFEGNQFCWHLEWTKKREAAPVAVRFYAQYGEIGTPIPVIVLRNNRPIFGYERPVGRGDATFCLDLPPELPLGVPLMVNGYIVYDMPHGLWRVSERFPEVRAN